MKGVLANKLNPSVRPQYKTFLRFLKDNGVFSRYFAIMSTKPAGNFISFYRGDVTFFLNTVICYNWTTECFIWDRQKEGRNFWENIHNKWNKYSYRKFK